MNRPSRCSRALVLLLVVALLLPALAVDPSLAARSQRPTPSQSADRQRVLPASSVPELLRGTPTLTPTTRATAPVTGAMQAVQSVYLPFIARGAGGLPDKAATARYVRWNWGDATVFTDPTTGVTSTATIAYTKGYNAPVSSFFSPIILGFGRQLEKGRVTGYGETLTEWKVLLPPQPNVTEQQRAKNHTWVISVTEEYMQGYNANPDHGDTVIAPGTNNANVAWKCNKDTFTEGLWWLAGQQWGQLIDQIAVPGDKVDLNSANDIESWAGHNFTYDDGTSWFGCGAGAKLWFEGYESVFADPYEDLLPVRNFGSDVYREPGGPWWNEEQTYNVYAGFNSARFHPQIYCPGWVGPLATFAAESEADPERGRIYFSGVTSENNGSSGTCGSSIESLTWQQSWLQFRDGLNAAGLYNDLGSSVSSFCILPVDTDKPCERYRTP